MRLLRESGKPYPLMPSTPLPLHGASQPPVACTDSSWPRRVTHAANSRRGASFTAGAGRQLWICFKRSTVPRALRSAAPAHYRLVRARSRGHAAFVARILIIDDDEEFRVQLLQMLAEAGHAAVAAVNGFEALKLFRAEQADLVLTDLMMPYGGLATIRILHDEFPKVGIIAMTGGGPHRLDYARSLGAHRTLTKPFTPEQLAAAIAEVLSAHPAHPAPKPEA